MSFLDMLKIGGKLAGVILAAAKYTGSQEFGQPIARLVPGE